MLWASSLILGTASFHLCVGFGFSESTFSKDPNTLKSKTLYGHYGPQIVEAFHRTHFCIVSNRCHLLFFDF